MITDESLLASKNQAWVLILSQGADSTVNEVNAK